MSESTIDVKLERQANQLQEHERLLAIQGERDKNRDRDSEKVLNELRDIKQLVTQALEIGKQASEIGKQTALGLVDANNRISRSDLEAVENGKRLTRLETENARLTKGLEEVQSEMKVSVGLRAEYFQLRDKWKKIEENEEANTKAREAAQNERELLKELATKNERNLRLVAIWAGFATTALVILGYLGLVHKP